MSRFTNYLAAALAVLPLLASGAEADRPATSAPPQVEQSPLAPSKDAIIDTVEVRARREAIRNAIHTFVARVTRSQDETLWRWRNSICPSVAGLPREKGEFILTRISQIAASAGAPLDRRQKCRTNLFVILTSEPARLLTAWMARDPRMFASDVTVTVNRFLNTPRPVRVWTAGRLRRHGGAGTGRPGRGLNEHAHDLAIVRELRPQRSCAFGPEQLGSSFPEGTLPNASDFSSTTFSDRGEGGPRCRALNRRA
jgi:hypothetical protein